VKKVCLCAHFGEGKELLNGQSIKAKVIAEEVGRKLGQDQVVSIDTHGGLPAVFTLTVLLLRAFITCKNIVIMPGRKGLRFFVPLTRIISFFLRRKTHYIVIGGWLDNYLQNRPFLRRLLYKCDYIYVETHEMKADLERNGFQNIVILANCKKLHILTESELVYSHASPYKLCTFSRVSDKKGIEDAVSAVTSINNKENRVVYSLDIYGPVDDNYMPRFNEIKGSFPEYISYCGTVPYDKTTEVIKDYFLVLFPTHYETEGLPGTLIDAYASGVPVVASDWRYSREFVDDGAGYIYDFKSVQALTYLLDTLKDDIACVNAKKTSCIKQAYRYTSETVIDILVSRLN